MQAAVRQCMRLRQAPCRLLCAIARVPLPCCNFFCVAVKCLDMVWDVSNKDNFSAVRNNSLARSLRIAKLFLLA